MSHLPGAPSKQDATTPAWLADLAVKEFKCGIDLAARSDNAITPRYIGPGSPIQEDLTDVLRGPCPLMTRRDAGWLNPEFAAPAPFLSAAIKWSTSTSSPLMMIVNVATDTDWWTDLIIGNPLIAVRFLTRRVKFGGYKKQRPAYPSVLLMHRHYENIKRIDAAHGLGLPFERFRQWSVKRLQQIVGHDRIER